MATHAQASLLETLTVMSTLIVREACVTIPVGRGDVDTQGDIASADIARMTRQALGYFVRAIRANPRWE